MHLAQDHLPPIGCDVPRAVEMRAHWRGNGLERALPLEACANHAEQPRAPRHANDEVPVIESERESSPRRDQSFEEKPDVPIECLSPREHARFYCPLRRGVPRQGASFQ